MKIFGTVKLWKFYFTIEKKSGAKLDGWARLINLVYIWNALNSCDLVSQAQFYHVALWLQ